MFWPVIAKCCCEGASDIIWQGARCSLTSCQSQPCGDCNQTCPAGITFCDKYRAQMGFPGAIAPGTCWIVVLGGCKYVVTGFTLGTCNPTPTPTHNSVSPLGVYAGTNCQSICSSIGGTYETEFVPFTGGMACGTSLTATFGWFGFWCNGSCDPPFGNDGQCIKQLSSFSLSFELSAWPNGITSQFTKCDQEPRKCSNCSEINPGATGGATFNASDQIPNNYCNDTDPTPNPCNDSSLPYGSSCNVIGSLSLNAIYNPNPPAAKLALTITRSCGCNTNWIAGDVLNGLQIDGCLFVPHPCGTDNNALAQKINEVLGGLATPCSASYTATAGECAHIGLGRQICPTNDCNGPLTDVVEPYVWLGPYMSSDNCTAEFYAYPQLAYQVSCGVFGSNFSRFNNNVGYCQCTGSPFGQWAVNYETDVVPIECNSTVSPGMMTFQSNPLAPPCCPPPVLS